MRRWGRWVVLSALALALTAAPAQAEDPPFVNWTSVLPALAPGFTENTFEVCRDGSPDCIQRTLTEMRRRLAALDAQCSHNALFLRNYRLITEMYASVYRKPGFYDDQIFFAQEDAVFAQLYFNAEDAWSAGRRADVPPAWQIAFDSAQERRVQGASSSLASPSVTRAAPVRRWSKARLRTIM